MDTLHHHERQIRRLRHAYRQRRRRRHHRAFGIAWRQAAASPRDRRRRIVRRGADLWRRRHHAGDLSAFGARGNGADRAKPAGLCAAGFGRRPVRAVRAATLRHGAYRACLRADHARMVRRNGGARPLWSGAAPAGSRRRQSALRRALFGKWRLQGLSRPWRRFPLRHRRRSALRRHGPFRRQADTARLACHRVSQPHPQLRRPNRDRPCRRSDRRQYFLPALPGRAADAARRVGDDRHRHRQPVDHHRRLFDDAAGDSARLAAALEHQADFGGGLRTNLHRCGQLDADDRHARSDARLPQIRQSRRRVWHRRFADNADDQHPALHRHARNLELAARGRRRRCRRIRHCRRQLLRRQHGQAAGGRLRAAHSGGDRLRHHVDLASRRRRRSRPRGRRPDADTGLS